MPAYEPISNVDSKQYKYLQGGAKKWPLSIVTQCQIFPTVVCRYISAVQEFLKIIVNLLLSHTAKKNSENWSAFDEAMAMTTVTH